MVLVGHPFKAQANARFCLAYFDQRITNGAVEGMNNKAKVVSHRCYGFRTAKNYITALYHCLGDLPEPKCVHRFL